MKIWCTWRCVDLRCEFEMSRIYHVKILIWWHSALSLISCISSKCTHGLMNVCDGRITRPILSINSAPLIVLWETQNVLTQKMKMSINVLKYCGMSHPKKESHGDHRGYHQINAHRTRNLNVMFRYKGWVCREKIFDSILRMFQFNPYSFTRLSTLRSYLLARIKIHK